MQHAPVTEVVFRIHTEVIHAVLNQQYRSATRRRVLWYNILSMLWQVWQPVIGKSLLNS